MLKVFNNIKVLKKGVWYNIFSVENVITRYRMVNRREKVPPIRKYTDLSPRKRAFVEYYIKSGGQVVESVFNAGFKQGCDRSDPKQRQLAYNLGRTMLKDPWVHDYITNNMPIPVSDDGVIDEGAIVDRMFLIMQGKIQRCYVDKKGDEKLEEPSFRDQCEAAKVLLDIQKMRDKKVPVEKRSKTVSKRVDDLIKTASFEYDA